MIANGQTSAYYANGRAPSGFVVAGRDPLPKPCAPSLVSTYSQTHKRQARRANHSRRVPGFGIEIVTTHILPRGSWVAMHESQALPIPTSDGYRAREILRRESGVPVDVAVATFGQDQI